jgi:DNA-binding beta-propeller fold protein YncE
VIEDQGFKRVTSCRFFSPADASFPLRLLLSTLPRKAVRRGYLQRAQSQREQPFLRRRNAHAMVPSPDGSGVYEAAIAESAVVKYNASNGQILTAYPTPADPVSVALSADGTMLHAVTGEIHAMVCAFNTTTGAEVGPVEAGYHGSVVGVSPDGDGIYAVNQENIMRFDPQTLSVLATIPVFADCLAFGPSSTHALYAGNSGGVTFLDTANDSIITSLYFTCGASGLAMNPSGTLQRRDFSTSCRDLDETHSIVGTIAPELVLGQVTLSPDGNSAICVKFPDEGVVNSVVYQIDIPSASVAKA